MALQKIWNNKILKTCLIIACHVLFQVFIFQKHNSDEEDKEQGEE